MEKSSCFSTNEQEPPMELPPGFRFHPTDEELITHYLSPKVLHNNFTTKAIGEVDLNKVEPWDLPWKAKMGEKEWYFFCVRDRKYPTGLRTNRATEAGYWKATGKDKEIFRAKNLVGMKKTLVFYKGRAPRGEKTNWVMHEYRLEGKNSMQNFPKSSKNEWVICRIFKKSSGGKKVHISGLMRSRECGADLPPLTDFSSDENQTRTSSANAESNLTYFSNPKEDHKDKTVDEFTSSSKNNDFSAHDQSLLRLLLDPNDSCLKQNIDIGANNDISSAISNNEMGFKPFEDHDFSIYSTGQVDLDFLWDY